MLNVLSAQGMIDMPSAAIFFDVPRQYYFLMRDYYAAQAQQAWVHNLNNQLLHLPHNTLQQILSYCLAQDDNQTKALRNSIKFFMQLSTTCYKLRWLVTHQTIGNLCKDYKSRAKTKNLKKVVQSMDKHTYHTKRLPALILICSGVFEKTEYDVYWLLEQVLANNDVELVATLFKHNAIDQNRKTIPFGHPILFCATTKKIAQMFIAHGADIHAINNEGKNILWIIAYNDPYPSKLLHFYLQQGVNARRLNHFFGSCLFHELARTFSDKNTDIDNFLKKAKLILNAIPDMINTLNNIEKTPLDVAQESLEIAYVRGTESHYYGKAEAYEKLIALFKQYGAKTVQEIINVIDMQGETPLIRTVKRKDIARVAQLLELGADANIRDNTKSKAIDYATSTAMVTLLMSHTKQEIEPSCIICFSTDGEIVDVPCTNQHDERMCLTCYNTLLSINDSCPLCRSAFKQ